MEISDTNAYGIMYVERRTQGIKLIRNLHKNTGRSNLESFPAYIIIKNREIFTG